MINDKETIEMTIELIDNNINEWQLYAKCNKMLCDFAFNIVNMLVDKKKEIVEKLKELDINI